MSLGKDPEVWSLCLDVDRSIQQFCIVLAQRAFSGRDTAIFLGGESINVVVRSS